MSYSHSSIHINNREVTIADIISTSASPLSEFELSAFSFIKDWLQGVESFKLHTSGSTGIPKEITLSRKQLQHSAQRTITALSLTENDAAFVCLDTKYIAGKMMLVRAMEGDMKIVVVEPSSNPLQKLSSQTKISFAAFVPLQLEEMIRYPDCIKRLNELKAIIIGGGAVNSTLHQLTKRLTCAVFATYGMTETVSHIALQRLNGTEDVENFITLPGISISIDVRGCLVIQLPEFQEKIITNDLVKLTSLTSFEWLGRADNIINSGGFKISPEKIEKEVELIFRERKIERPFFVYGLSDDRLGQKLILIIEGFPITGEKKILSSLAQRLHEYEIPKQIFHIRQFIRTETGKINRLKTAELIG